MANIKMDRSNYGRQFGNTAYGNTTTLTFSLKTGTGGAVIGGDTDDPIDAADVVDLGPLPEGMRLDDAQVIVHVGMTATVVGKLGFKYADGVDDSGVPQADDYFGTAINLDTAGRKRATAGNALVTLPKPARLILTTATAKNVKASSATFLVVGELIGPR